MYGALDKRGEMWFVHAAMRASWPDASRIDSFEGRVLSRATPLIDFRLPLGEGAAEEESVLFVVPPGYEDIEYDVDIEAEGIGLSPIPRAPVAPDVSLRHSTPGAHWLVAPPTLPPDDPRVSGSFNGWGDEENTVPLPVFPLYRRRRVNAERVASAVFGGATPARAARFGLALAALFAVLAFKSLGGRAPTLNELTQMGDEVPAAAPAANVASIPRVVVPTRPAPRPTIIRADAPVWIVMPRREVAPPPVPPTADHPLGLPRPTPAPRTEMARL
jgi:hypothetical protein